MRSETGEYIRAWRARWQAEREQTTALAQRARQTAERIARTLIERHGASRVLLTGSLARGSFRRGSDIDLAVEGLAPADLFRAGADADRLADGFEVDLVPLESASQEYADRLTREGVELRGTRAE